MNTDRPYRMGPILLTAVTMILLLILINLTMYAVTMRNAEKILAEAPELAALVHAQSRVGLFLIGLISLFYLAGVVLATSLGSWRATAAAYITPEENDTLNGLAEELDRVAADELGAAGELPQGRIGQSGLPESSRAQQA